DHRLAIQPVDDHRRRARRAQLPGLAGRPGSRGDLGTGRDQLRNEVLSQCPGRSRDENSHDLSFRLVLSREDNAAPGAVTLSSPAFPAARATPRTAFAPSAEQELICMPPVTALHRPGTPHPGSSALAADSAATRCPPRSRASASRPPAASPTARGCRNRAVTPASQRATVSGQDRSAATAFTPSGRLAGPVPRMTARTPAPSLTRRPTKGRPMVPAAPVTRITPRPPIYMGA